MSENEKLQKAVSLIIAAGYQLSKEAFEFLSTIAITENPVEIATKAIRKIEALKEKRLFIDKSLIEGLVKETEPEKEILTRPQEEQTPRLDAQITEGKKFFSPYAKDVEASINIIDDPGSKLSSSGTIDDY
ncbi:MAG: hypothetical protein QXH37_02755 [Candidatus Bathyarchaeia archaeon]